jgi:hypothetical protein
MVFFECPGAVVTWDDAVKCVELRFRGYIEGNELREAALSVLTLLEKHRACKVLTDSRDMKALTQEDQRWIDVEWRQKAKSTGLTYNALVLPKSSVAKLSAAAVLKKLPANEIELAYFSSPEEAKRWLRSK